MKEIATLRPYQAAAVQSVYEHLRTRDDNPCVVLPTGTGKSHVIGQIVTDAVTRWGGRVLVLAHVKELLEQNSAKILEHTQNIDVGIYSAALKSRDTEQSVIVAGIQSVYKRACELGKFDLIIIDEAHLIPTEGDGMYRQYLADAQIINPNVRLIGLTATPYRLKGGEICAPENILNYVCYEAGLREMILDGYLSTIRSRNGKRSEVDVSNLRVSYGEFVLSEMAEAFDKKDLVRAACLEIAELTAKRKSILVFAASVAHAYHVAEELADITKEECCVVVGDTPADERAEIVARFKGETIVSDLFGNTKGPIRFLINVQVFTTGFDATNVDCIVMLFSTASPGLYVQVVGRGTRLHPGKEDCLVLDYGKNVMRHGPVDMVTPPSKKRGGNNNSESPTKECPNCGSLIHAAYQICPDCGTVLPEPERAVHGWRADGTPILSGDVVDEEYPVYGTFYRIHTKKGADPDHPKTMRVEYNIDEGLSNHWISEWVCPEHTGYARDKFVKWWAERSDTEAPRSVETAVNYIMGTVPCPIKEPAIIKTRYRAGDRFEQIVGYVFDDTAKPEPKPIYDEDEEEIPF